VACGIDGDHGPAGATFHEGRFPIGVPVGFGRDGMNLPREAGCVPFRSPIASHFSAKPYQRVDQRAVPPHLNARSKAASMTARYRLPYGPTDSNSADQLEGMPKIRAAGAASADRCTFRTSAAHNIARIRVRPNWDALSVTVSNSASRLHWQTSRKPFTSLLILMSKLSMRTPLQSAGVLMLGQKDRRRAQSGIISSSRAP
jgi:hypothetical protein